MKTLLKIMLLILILVYFSGCASASLVRQTYNPKGGTVMYNNSRMMSNSNSVKAKELMVNYCGGTYQIEQKEVRSRVSHYQVQSNAFGNGYNATPVHANFIAIDFKCDKGS